VRVNLQQNGFLATFTDTGEPWSGNSITYREDREQDANGVVKYLKEMWLGRKWVHISPLFSDAIVGTVWEIYANAFEHGKSAVGVMSCGQHYPYPKTLSLSVVDFGVGIPSNVRIHQRLPNMPARETMEWAFRRGTTTKPNGIGRGLGLDLLKEFVRINQGRLEAFSHEGYALIDKDQETYHNRDFFFEGTLLNITLRCDESYYSFASEISSEPLF
jgi:signal transduction histidine kinase